MSIAVPCVQYRSVCLASVPRNDLSLEPSFTSRIGPFVSEPVRAGSRCCACMSYSADRASEHIGIAATPSVECSWSLLTHGFPSFLALFLLSLPAATAASSLRRHWRCQHHLCLGLQGYYPAINIHLVRVVHGICSRRRQFY